ncbi:hypothetical protein PMZ80_005875 [Knufia obscura]|uniref:Uncharacterized protein n=2 Tax=Knufia TaxID=430999 RepID=A0AAN8I4U2_9EURO|nr:hypothetical protein PMZ80_005875 [Knufia obscura]KAK5954542.1 hypothetical protein OHC33_004264 [Knufia fluminis]
MSSENPKTTSVSEVIDDPQMHHTYANLLPHIIALICPPLAVGCAQGIPGYHFLISFLVLICFGYHTAQVHATFALWRYHGNPFEKVDLATATVMTPHQVEGGTLRGAFTGTIGKIW